MHRDTLDLGVVVLDLRVLRARLRRRRALLARSLLAGAALIMLLVLAVGIYGRAVGSGVLVLEALPPESVVRVDERVAPGHAVTLVAGVHQVTVTRDGFYAARRTVTITRAQTTTVTLPPLRPRPLVQPVPLPAPGARWVSAAAQRDAWRLGLAPPELEPTPDPRLGDLGSATRPTVARYQLDELGLQRRAAVDVDAAADEVVTVEGRFWAAWEVVGQRMLRRDGAVGQLTVTTSRVSTVVTTTADVAGVWWSPAGDGLLVAQPRGRGQDLSIWRAARPATLTPLVAVPGQVQAVHWHPEGRAAVVISALPIDVARDRTPTLPPEATLIVLGDDAAPRTLRLAAGPPTLLGMPLFTWTADGLLWAATDGTGVALQHVPRDGRLPTRRGVLPAGVVALRCAGAEVRLLVRDLSGRLQLVAWPDGALLADLDDLPVLSPSGPAGALWRGTTLLLAASESELWQITFVNEALR